MDDCATYLWRMYTTHALSSVRAAESALNIDVPLTRNTSVTSFWLRTPRMTICSFLSAFGAGLGGHHFCTASDPTKASEMLKGVSTWHLNSPKSSLKFRTRSKIWLPAVSWDFRQWLLGSPGDETAAGSEPIAVAHYLQALECQRDANRVVRCWAVKRRTFRTWR